MSRIVESLQNMVAIYIINLSDGEDTLIDLKTTIRCLDYFFNSNHELKRVDDSEFINPTVSDNLSMKTIAEEYYHSKKGAITKDDNYFVFLDYPWLFSTEAKVEVIQMESKLTQRDQVINNIMGGLTGGNSLSNFLAGGINPHLQITIRRDHILEDALNQLSSQDNSLKKPLRVKFTGEDGVDEGGVKKEFFYLLIEQLFNPNYAMFITKNVRNLSS